MSCLNKQIRIKMLNRQTDTLLKMFITSAVAMSTQGVSCIEILFDLVYTNRH